MTMNKWGLENNYEKAQKIYVIGAYITEIMAGILLLTMVFFSNFDIRNGVFFLTALSLTIGFHIMANQSNQILEMQKMLNNTKRNVNKR